MPPSPTNTAGRMPIRVLGAVVLVDGDQLREVGGARRVRVVAVRIEMPVVVERHPVGARQGGAGGVDLGQLGGLEIDLVEVADEAVLRVDVTAARLPCRGRPCRAQREAERVTDGVVSTARPMRRAPRSTRPPLRRSRSRASTQSDRRIGEPSCSAGVSPGGGIAVGVLPPKANAVVYAPHGPASSRASSVPDADDCCTERPHPVGKLPVGRDDRQRSRVGIGRHQLNDAVVGCVATAATRVDDGNVVVHPFGELARGPAVEHQRDRVVGIGDETCTSRVKPVGGTGTVAPPPVGARADDVHPVDDEMRRHAVMP